MTRNIWRRYASFFDGQRTLLLSAVLLGALQVVALVPVPLLIRQALDVAIPQKDMSQLIMIAFGLLLSKMLEGSLVIASRWAALRSTKHAVTKMRDLLFARLHASPRVWFDRADRERIRSLVVTDTERVDVMSNLIVSIFLPALAASAGLAIILAFWQPRLFLAAMLPMPLFVLTNRLMRRAMRTRVQRFRAAFEQFGRHADFALRRADLIRASGSVASERTRERASLDVVRKVSGDMSLLHSSYSQMQYVFLMLSCALVLVAGGVLMERGAMTLGTLVSFFVALRLLIGPLAQGLGSLPDIFVGTAALAAIVEALDDVHVPPYSGGTMKPELHTVVRVDDVTFAYDTNDTARPLLDVITFELERGTITAISGANGSGKTTVARLLAGEYAPTRGTIRIDDIAYKNIEPKHLTSLFGYIAQDPDVFHGTISDNIRYGSVRNDHNNDATVLQLTDRFVNRLPAGYDTVVGHDGCTLSGGERQLICLTRVLLREPPVLILDEPSVHLDAAAVRALLELVRTLPWRPVVLLITHDPALLQLADDVHHLESGRLTRTKRLQLVGERV